MTKGVFGVRYHRLGSPKELPNDRYPETRSTGCR